VADLLNPARPKHGEVGNGIGNGPGRDRNAISTRSDDADYVISRFKRDDPEAADRIDLATANPVGTNQRVAISNTHKAGRPTRNF